VERQIEIPIPEEGAVIDLPRMQFERSRFLGRESLRIRGSDSEGLREGWVFVDGQKEMYAAWNGERDGVLEAPLPSGEYVVHSKIETESGVSVIEIRHVAIH
jgi:hypothetical protein